MTDSIIPSIWLQEGGDATGAKAGGIPSLWSCTEGLGRRTGEGDQAAE